MTYSKIFSIEVVSSGDCAVFNGIAWDSPSYTGTASGSFLGNALSLNCATPDGGTSFDLSQASTVGYFSYTGPEIVCNFHLNLTVLSGIGSNFSPLVYWGPDSDTILDVYKVTPDATGSFDFPVTLPESVADDVYVIVSAQGGYFDFTPGGTTHAGQITASGSFGNPP